MVEQAISWGIGIIMMVEISYILYLNIVRISAKIKCRKKRYCKPLNICHETNCKFAEYCENYEYTYTKEEMASLRELVEEINRQRKR